MKYERVMSLKKENLYYRIVVGIAWIGAGIVSLWSNLPCLLLDIFFMVVALIFMVICARATIEKNDEMSDMNLIYAKAYAYDQLRIIALCAVIFMSFLRIISFQVDWNWCRIMDSFAEILLGLTYFFVGYKFRKLEE